MVLVQKPGMSNSYNRNVTIIWFPEFRNVTIINTRGFLNSGLLKLKLLVFEGIYVFEE